MPELHKENEDLKTKLESIVKEINVIKDNILLLNRGRNLPDEILKLIQQFENECKDG
jgi:cell division protein FtsB